jgi:Tol biopolymer transport system component
MAMKRSGRIACAAAAAVTAVLCAALPAHAAFPGGNGRVAFSSQTLDANGQFVGSQIEAVNPDGSARALLVGCRRARNCNRHDPTWSPNGQVLAFAARDRLGTVQANGSNANVLQRRTIRDGDPAWAADGQRLAFTGVAQANAAENVFILGCPGCGIRQLTFRGGNQPAWSSTDRVAFTRAGNLYTMGSNSTRATRLTYKGGSQADWSPFASKLAFVRAGNVYIVRASGKGLARVTGRGGTQPVWSPDGKQLAFVRAGSIYIVGTDGRGLRQLAALGAPNPPGAGYRVRLVAPSWQPLR